MNVVALAGHLGKDIDVRFLPGGKVEGTFDLALREYMGKSNETGEARYDTVWVECCIKDQRAQSLQDELQSGRFVTVHGRLRTSKWKISDDKSVRYTYVLVESVEFDRKASNPNSANALGKNGQ